MSDFETPALIGTIQKAAGAQLPRSTGDDVPFIVVQADQRVEGLEHLLAAPVSTKAALTLHDAESFTAYVSRFADQGTLIFANENGGKEPKLVAVIDYSEKASPRHAKHRVTLSPRVSEQWTRWNAVSGKRMAQAEFARFLEENSLDVNAPNAATLIEVARSIEATKAGAFRSGVRLNDGSFQLTYSEEVTATAGAGKLTIPEKITLGIPVFERGQLYAVDAWFRYRIEEGKLQLWVDLHRSRFIFDDAFSGLISAVTAANVAPVLFGTPPA